jgi:hypothetical protein
MQSKMRRNREPFFIKFLKIILDCQKSFILVLVFNFSKGAVINLLQTKSFILIKIKYIQQVCFFWCKF